MNAAASLAAAARAVDTLDRDGFADALLELVQQSVPIDTAMVFAFRRDAVPEILHDRLAADERDAFYGGWLAGVYLLSPFWRAFVDGVADGFHRVRTLAPEGFRASEYYRQYYRHTGSSDLGGFLVRLDGATGIVVTIGRRAATPPFSRAEQRRLAEVSPLVAALARRHWRRLAAPSGDGAGHRRFSDRLRRFGEQVLTEREREVLHLLLGGHSVKATARVLGISPETARVHRRHVYAKLGVGSQGELFSRVMDALADE